MNLFWKRIFGGLENTAKYEANFYQQYADLQRMVAIRQSAELAEYNNLFEEVKSPEFKENKKTLINRKYRDTEYYRDFTKFKKLDTNPQIKRYYEVAKSAILEEYIALKEDSVEYMKLSDKKELAQNPKLKELKTFEKSKDYKIYTRYHNSYTIKEYEELSEKVKTPEFIEGNKFWSNPNRWQTTEDYKTEQRYFAICANEDIKFYLKYNGTTGNFGIFEDYVISFDEAFKGDKAWKSGFYHPAEGLKKQYSFAEHRSANCNKNSRIEGNKLIIATAKEACQAPVWDSKFGFVMHDFDYAADTVHGHDVLLQKEGVYMIKALYNGANINHNIVLKGEKTNSAAIVVASANKGMVNVGLINNGKFVGTNIGGLKEGESYIYTIVWNEKEIVWFINNIEVFRTSENLPKEALYPMFSSYIENGAKDGDGKLVIDYLKVYSLREK